MKQPKNEEQFGLLFFKEKCVGKEEYNGTEVLILLKVGDCAKGQSLPEVDNVERLNIEY